MRVYIGVNWRSGPGAGCLSGGREGVLFARGFMLIMRSGFPGSCFFVCVWDLCGVWHVHREDRPG